jgi:hypothetical protein
MLIRSKQVAKVFIQVYSNKLSFDDHDMNKIEIGSVILIVCKFRCNTLCVVVVKIKPVFRIRIGFQFCYVQTDGVPMIPVPLAYLPNKKINPRNIN